ncbi:MAG: hypothetical protein Q7K37_10850 [Dehalococcoidia bacterium]|nr:hypothetical protein [Dehalococcoidia bacterium]
MSLWRLEWLRLRRTWRGVGLLAVFVFFGLVGPLTARYIQEILESFGGTDGVQVIFPPPVPADGMIQYLSNAQQIGLLAVIGVAAGALSFDATADIAIFLRTRVSSTARLVLTRTAVYAAAAALAFVVGALVAWYETWALIGLVPADRFLFGTLFGALYYVFVVAMVALAAGLVRGSLGTMVLAFAFVVVPQVTVGLVSAAKPWLPGHLSSALAPLSQGTAEAGDFVRATVLTLAVIALALVVAIRLLDRREV